MKKLTVIIPFLNEGEEIRNTVESLISHGGEQVELILINDASEDGYDYEQVAKDYETHYVRHDQRRGVAASRDEGVELCTTPYFLLLDGHMRFYENNWPERIVGELEKEDRQLLCCQTRVLKCIDGVVSVDTGRMKAFCAGINICNADGVLDFQWSVKEREPDRPAEDVPCVLGAAYAASRRYWQYLKGLDGLLYYGSDEVYISIKVWLEGGRCRLLKDIVIGHIYRNAFPYPVDNRYTLYNKLFISELLLPVGLKNQVFGTLQKQKSDFYPDAFQWLVENRGKLRELKDWYRQIFTHDFDLIVQLNNDR